MKLESEENYRAYVYMHDNAPVQKATFLPASVAFMLIESNLLDGQPVPRDHNPT